MEIRRPMADRDYFLADGPVFQKSFFTVAKAYDRRERAPFPPVNVYVSAKMVLVQALLPGVDRKDVGVRLEDGDLIIEGAMPRMGGRYLHEERFHGPFGRRVILKEKIEGFLGATLRDGILQIALQREHP